MTVPLYNLTDTWNNGATTFTGIGFNVTNTASANGSSVLSIQLNSVPVLTVQGPDGNCIVNQQGQAFSTHPFQVQFQGTAVCQVDANGGYNITTTNGAVNLGGGSVNNFITWGGFVTLYNPVTFGILEQRQGTNANTFRVYNTFTDTSNYERGVFDWTTTANTLTIGTQAAGTGSNRPMALITGGTVGATITTAQSFVMNNAAIATNATDGFLYIATCAGAPSGTPTTQTGRVAIVWDTTNHKFWVFDGAWKGGTNPGVWT